MEHIVEIYFIGGSNVVFTRVLEEEADKIITWFGNDENGLFKMNTVKANTSTFLKKEQITHINVI